MKPLEFELIKNNLLLELTDNQIAKELKTISKNFTTDRDKIKDYVLSKKMVSAYSCFYLPTNVPKFDFLMSMLPLEVKTKIENSSFLDFGTGPGTYLLAFMNYFQGSTSKIIGVDSSELMLEQAKKFVDSMFDEDQKVELLKKIPHGHSGGTLFFGNSLNEIGVTKASSIVKEVAPETILLIEPGTRESFSSIMEFRTNLLDKGFSINYPCPSASKKCPISEDKENWCHQILRMVHGPEVERFGQLASLDRKSMPMISYCFSRTQITSPTKATLFRFMRETKHSFEWQVCLEDEENLIIFEIPKRNMKKKEVKDFTNLSVGIKFEYEVLKVLKSDFWRVKIKGL
ncbi:MAG: hypothetical protein KC493_16255 [Bacteriovoracaceae bacterium]|nr:hypothetical protein [Bacteriovoracaceae bacterium]